MKRIVEIGIFALASAMLFIACEKESVEPKAQVGGSLDMFYGSYTLEAEYSKSGNVLVNVSDTCALDDTIRFDTNFTYRSIVKKTIVVEGKSTSVNDTVVVAGSLLVKSGQKKCNENKRDFYRYTPATGKLDMFVATKNLAKKLITTEGTPVTRYYDKMEGGKLYLYASPNRSGNVFVYKKI